MITGEEKTKTTGEKEYGVTIDNGDLKLIDSLVVAYGFKDRDSLLKFGIAALLDGNNHEGIFIVKTSDDGQKKLSRIAPPAELLVEKKSV